MEDILRPDFKMDLSWNKTVLSEVSLKFAPTGPLTKKVIFGSGNGLVGNKR